MRHREASFLWCYSLLFLVIPVVYTRVYACYTLVYRGLYLRCYSLLFPVIPLFLCLMSVMPVYARYTMVYTVINVNYSRYSRFNPVIPELIPAQTQGNPLLNLITLRLTVIPGYSRLFLVIPRYSPLFPVFYRFIPGF